MQKAFERDMAAIKEDGSYEYVDGDSPIIDIPTSVKTVELESEEEPRVAEVKEDTKTSTVVEEKHVQTIDEVPQEEIKVDEKEENTVRQTTSTDGLLDDFFN